MNKKKVNMQSVYWKRKQNVNMQINYVKAFSHLG